MHGAGGVEGLRPDAQSLVIRWFVPAGLPHSLSRQHCLPSLTQPSTQEPPSMPTSTCCALFWVLGDTQSKGHAVLEVRRLPARRSACCVLPSEAHVPASGRRLRALAPPATLRGPLARRLRCPEVSLPGSGSPLASRTRSRVRSGSSAAGWSHDPDSALWGRHTPSFPPRVFVP